MIEDLRAGDPVAWAEWIRDLGPSLERYAARAGHPDPPEVAGAVLETLAARIGDFHGGPEDLRTFAFSVAHARVVDAHRRRARRRGALHTLGDPAVAPADASAAIDPQDAPDAAGTGSTGDRAELSEQVQAMWGHLSPVERAVMTALHLEGLSIAETARRTGRSEGAVRAASFRARRRLRSLLGAPPDR